MENKFVVALDILTMYFNPIVIISTIILSEYLGPLSQTLGFAFSKTVSTNVTYYPFIPYTLLSFIIWLIITILKFGLTRATQGPITFEQFFQADFLSQLVYLPLLLFTSIILRPMEGNVMGILIFPVFLLYSAVTLPASFYLFFRSIKKTP